jgi:hypothetical protein
MLVADQLREAARLNEERDNIYKDNHERTGAMLQALFPKGVVLRSETDHKRFALLVLMAVKLSRYCVAWNDPDPDHMPDLTVYSAMMENIDADRRGPGQSDNQRTDGNASAAHFPHGLVAVLGDNQDDDMGSAHRPTAK